ncbi:MAG: hypothetical protein IJM30_02370 [Thermoguttaceae bacterium]|nr:hypothetical protein [Thermoguttaceae bacterium]
MGSVAVYAKLRKTEIPAETRIYAKVVRGSGGAPTDNRVGDWSNRVRAWTEAMKF